MPEYVCRLCDQVFSKIPEGSVDLGFRSRCGKMWKFPAGRVHCLRAVKPQPSEHQKLRNHARWHVTRNISKPDCIYCAQAKIEGVQL